MEGINHSSRERHSWSDRGRKRDKNVLSPFGSQGTLLWPFATLSLCHPSGFSCGTTASSIRPLCPLAALHYSTTSITACAPNDWRIRRAAAAARHGPLRSSLFLRLSSCSPVGQSSTLSSGAPTYWELIGGRVSFESTKSKTTESRSSNMFPDWTLISSPESVPSNLLSFFSFCLR